MPGYDPYLELLGIPPDRRPPSHRELLGVGPDENDVEKIEAAARKRHEYLGNYTISPQEEVAACAKRLLHEVGSALAALRNLLTSERPHEEAKAPAEGAMPPPLPSAVPLPPPGATVATGIPPPVEQGNVVGVAAAAVAEGASPFPVGAPAFVEAEAPEGGDLPDLGEIPIPLPWKRGLARAGGLFRGMAAGVRSIPRRLWGIVRWGDGLLRSIAGEENAILHRFLRMVAIALLVPAVVYAGLLALSGLADLRRAGPSPSEVASSPEHGTVRIELSDAPAKVEIKVDGDVVELAKVVGRQGLVLSARDHRLEVASEGFEDYASSFTVRVGSQEVLRVALTAKPPPGPPPAIAPFDAAAARQHQETWSKHLGLPVETANSIGMKMQLIPAGEFTMGSPPGEGKPDEHPQHPVRITKPFWIGAREVTVGEFRQFVNESGYTVTSEGWKTAFPSQTDDHPVSGINWTEAKAFCDWLSKKEHKEYRLPTEAEWEYACRAGSAGKYCFGDDGAALGEYAWHSGNSGSQTRPVGQKKPNPWGLHDVHGNAWEWCADWYGSDYYASSPTDDPQGPSSGADRVLRGGSWSYDPRSARSAMRGRLAPDDRDLNFGFRVARTP